MISLFLLVLFLFPYYVLHLRVIHCFSNYLLLWNAYISTEVLWEPPLHFWWRLKGLSRSPLQRVLLSTWKDLRESGWSIGRNRALREIDRPHCRPLARSLLISHHGYARQRMTLYISFTVNSKGAICAMAVHYVGGMKLLKEGYGRVILNGHNRYRSVKMLNDEDGAEWPA